MSWKKRLRGFKKNVSRLGRSARKQIKRGGRNLARTAARIAPIKTAILAAGVTYTFGPVAGGVVVGVGGEMSRYWGSTAARAKGIKGHEAKVAGRNLRKEAYKYGLAGVGLGFTAAVGAGALGLAGSGTGGNAVAGVVGSKALWGAPAVGQVPINFVTGEGTRFAGTEAARQAGMAAGQAAAATVSGASSGVAPSVAAATAAKAAAAAPGIGVATMPAAGGFWPTVGATAEKLAPLAANAATQLLQGKKVTPPSAGSLLDLAIGGDTPGGEGGGTTGEGPAGLDGGDLVKLALIAGGAYVLMKAA